MSASVQHATIEQHARQRYLTTVADQFAPLAEEALHNKQSHLSYLEALLEAELEERDRRAVMRRIAKAAPVALQHPVDDLALQANHLSGCELQACAILCNFAEFSRPKAAIELFPDARERGLAHGARQG